MFMIDPIAIKPAMLISNVAASTVPNWISTATYAKDVDVIDPDTHIIYKSLADGNNGNNPAINKLKWKKIGIDNRWAMLDSSIGSKTTNAGDIQVTITPGALANAVTLFVKARAVRIRVLDPIEGVVYDKTMNMISTLGINSWAAWYRQAISSKVAISVVDLPSYFSASIEITIFAVNGFAECSLCVVGARVFIGRLKYKFQIGFDPWSVKTRDEWGGWTVVPRDASDALSFPVYLDRRDVKRVKDLIKKYHAKLIVYIGDVNDESTFIYGYAESFDLVVEARNSANYSFKVQSGT